MSESSAGDVVARRGDGRHDGQLAPGGHRRRRDRRDRGGRGRRRRDRAADGRPRHAPEGAAGAGRGGPVRLAARHPGHGRRRRRHRAVLRGRRGRARDRRARPAPRAGSSAARPRAPVTVVFSHGYCLSQDSWHFQRAALRGVVRTVLLGPAQPRPLRRAARAQAADGVPVTIDQLGRDLKAVIDAAAPEGPLVLVGHSMGGMTMMALADQYPELVRERVVGVAFVGTSSRASSARSASGCRSRA